MVLGRAWTSKPSNKGFFSRLSLVLALFFAQTLQKKKEQEQQDKRIRDNTLHPVDQGSGPGSCRPAPWVTTDFSRSPVRHFFCKYFIPLPGKIPLLSCLFRNPVFWYVCCPRCLGANTRCDKMPQCVLGSFVQYCLNNRCCCCASCLEPLALKMSLSPVKLGKILS